MTSMIIDFVLNTGLETDEFNSVGDLDFASIVDKIDIHYSECSKYDCLVVDNKPMEKKNKLLLIDGSSAAFRAFFALYNQIDRFKSPSGLHTNAIYGFHLMLNHLLERVQSTQIGRAHV